MQKKTAIQLALMGLSVAMIGFGVWRGEADTVYEPAQQHPQQNENTGDVIGKTEF